MDVVKSLVRHYTILSAAVRTGRWIKGLEPDSQTLMPDMIEDVVDRFPNHAAFRFEGRLVTYREFDFLANQVAHWAIAQGMKPGDTVALFMENRPEYAAIWYGLSKVGIVAGLINSNLTSNALAHCVNIAGAKHVIIGEEQDAAIATALDLFDEAPVIWAFGGEAGKSFSAALASMPSSRPERTYREGLRGRDLCLYVYTSGTTGLPKAAKLTHIRIAGMMRTFIGPCRIRPSDRIYVTLPLYHGTGGICGVGMALMTGACVVLKRRFSASEFWDDCVEQKVSLIVYIGELCRYLLNQPARASEAAHSVRGGFGNGLRPDIWEQFINRFSVPKMIEFYGSTEGNVSFMNTDGKVGAVGRIPFYLKRYFDHIAFVKYDVLKEEPVRGDDGFCIHAETDEPGEALGRVGDEARMRFEGYQDAGATKNKILRDVFEPGDMWFRTGDLMQVDAEKYVYFVDRIGDTFRWKGENVSTNEVAEVLVGETGITTANVYGVAVPDSDGKAGMAAITVSQEIDFSQLYQNLEARLPKYAIPLFIRVQQEAETTGTFKYRKVDLVEDGFDVTEITDPVWYFDPDAAAYLPLTADMYSTLISGAIRF